MATEQAHVNNTGSEDFSWTCRPSNYKFPVVHETGQIWIAVAPDRKTASRFIKGMAGMFADAGLSVRRAPQKACGQEIYYLELWPLALSLSLQRRYAK